jgi:hypothetical protein
MTKEALGVIILDFFFRFHGICDFAIFRDFDFAIRCLPLRSGERKQRDESFVTSDVAVEFGCEAPCLFFC